MPLETPPARRAFWRFCVVGTSGVVVNLAALAALTGAGLVSTLASALAIELSVLSNFALNDRWTFSALRGERAWWARLARFQLVSLVGASAQWLTFVLGVAALARLGVPGWEVIDLSARDLLAVVREPPQVGAWQYVAQLAGVGVATLWNFLANFYWTWGRAAARG
jgi:putative flippase GtrA